MADTQCQHLYCPHLHFKKCRRERERKIPYTTRPTKDIDLTCNVHQKMINLTTRNISTLAYQQYSESQVMPAQDETNFSKNYYLENCPDKVQMRNTLVKDQQEFMAEHNAYVLAIDATKEYDIFSKRRKDYLKNAQKRAKISYHNYFQNKKEEMVKLKEEQSKWVTDYYRKVEELIDHIFGKKNQNADPNLQDKLFIKQNQAKNAKYFAGVKVSNPSTALEILQSLRALLLRKKISLQDERKDQQHNNKSATASYMDASQSQSQDVTQGTSFMSAATNVTQQLGESHFAEQFCDFQSMEKRWGIKDVTEIRSIIMRLLSKNMIIKAEGKQMRVRKAAKEKNEFLKKQMAEMMGKSAQGAAKTNKAEKNSKTGKRPQSARTKTTDNHLKVTTEDLPIFRQSLTSQDQQIKKSILRGGIFDSVGDKYQRNRNFSQLFKRKKQQSQFQLSFREQTHYRPPQTTRK